MKKTAMLSAFIALVILLSGLAAGCKKDNEKPGNELPKVLRIQFSPPLVLPGSSVKAVVDATDKEGDKFDLEYEWVVGKEKVRGTTGPVLETGNYGAGVKVTVRVRLKELPSGRETEWKESSFTLGSAPPETIVGVSIEPNPLLAGQNVQAVVDYGDADSNNITLYYRWVINGKEMTDEEYQDSELDGKLLKMGDQVMLQVSDDEEFKGQMWFSPVLTVTNNSPVFTTVPYMETQGKTVLIKFEVEDPDGDNLTYSITDAPPGTGRIEDGYSINLDRVSPGEYNMTIGAYDGKGGSATYEISLTIPEKAQPVPAEPPADEDTGEANEDVGGEEENPTY